MKGNGETHAALITVTPQALAQALRLKPGATITGADWDSIRHQLTLRLDGPRLPRTPEAATPRLLSLERAQQPK